MASSTVEIKFDSESVTAILDYMRALEGRVEALEATIRRNPVLGGLTLAQGRPQGYVTRTSGSVLPERGYTIA